MNTQWELWFEQCELPTENQVIQMSMGDNKNLKLIFLNKNQAQNEFQTLIKLIREHMDVFTWDYKNLSRLDPNIVQHHLNIKFDAKLA